MRDRQPTKPGRVLLTPEDGSPAFYATMTMADEPTDLGTPPTKANLLTDETEMELFGSAADRTVNQAFAAIGFRFQMLANSMATLSVTVKDSNDLAAKNVEIEGMFDESGGAVYTNDSGVATGYVSEGNVTLRISGYADIEDASDTFTAVAGGTYIRTITVTRRTYLKLLSSANFRFSGNVATVDVALGGGGAGGSWGSSLNSASAQRWQQGGYGGGAGSVSERTGITPNSRTVYSAIVGAGGGEAAAGGASSFLGVSAKGGVLNAGGRGARINYPIIINGSTTVEGSSVTATVGKDGTGRLYASMTETFAYGGDGGGGGASGSMNYYGPYLTPSLGGAPGGGKGSESGYASGNWENAPNGTDGLGGGGGGAGSAYFYNGDKYVFASMYPGKGGSGCITVRIHLAA